jgi:hypothetical protein
MKAVVLMTVLAALAAGQTQTAGDVRARRVIDDAVAALGGEKFLNMQDRVMDERTSYHDRLSGLTVAKIYTRYLTVPPRRPARVGVARAAVL